MNIDFFVGLDTKGLGYLLEFNFSIWFTPKSNWIMSHFLSNVLDKTRELRNGKHGY